MSEGPEIEQKREDLRREKGELNGAMDIIVNLERREREQAAQYINGLDASQAESMASLGAAHPNGRVADNATIYSTTHSGDV
jgi:hypothetical protein